MDWAIGLRCLCVIICCYVYVSAFNTAGVSGSKLVQRLRRSGEPSFFDEASGPRSPGGSGGPGIQGPRGGPCGSDNQRDCGNPGSPGIQGPRGEPEGQHSSSGGENQRDQNNRGETQYPVGPGNQGPRGEPCGSDKQGDCGSPGIPGSRGK